MKKKATNKKTKQINETSRPPIVVVLGHVDHGKTTLLDAIRQTNVVKRESGGITQHIGAYQIEFQTPSTDSTNSLQASSGQAKKITFIDTPGHEAFAAMRSRGAKVADIAILVIAAEEGIKPQTKEVISYIKELKIPAIVAINKIDKPNANPEKVLNELSAEGIVVESRGGDVLSANISALNGQGINDILEAILLIAEVEELKEHPKQPAQGVVIEAHLDSQKGPLAVLLIEDGTLKKDDFVVAGQVYGRVKNLMDFNKKAIEQAEPSMPVIVMGLHQIPKAGDDFLVEYSEEAAMQRACLFKPDKQNKNEAGDKNKKKYNLILKADAQGSMGAIQETLSKISQTSIELNILKSEVGDISEFDIKLAQCTQAAIVGFHVQASNFISGLARREGIRLKIFTVIYELVEEVKKAMSKLLESKIEKKEIGQLEIVEIFRREKAKMIVGGKVLSGQVENKTMTDILRPRRGGEISEEDKIGMAKIVQLQHNKKDVPEVTKGKEAGLLLEGKPVAEEGDILRVYKEEKIQEEL